jgi:hypothetical protein
LLLLILDADSAAKIVEYAGAIATVILSAKAITIITPTKTDDAVYNALAKVLNILALNVGKDKNADAE